MDVGERVGERWRSRHGSKSGTPRSSSRAKGREAEKNGGTGGGGGGGKTHGAGIESDDLRRRLVNATADTSRTRGASESKLDHDTHADAVAELNQYRGENQIRRVLRLRLEASRSLRDWFQASGQDDESGGDGDDLIREQARAMREKLESWGAKL